LLWANTRKRNSPQRHRGHRDEIIEPLAKVFTKITYMSFFNEKVHFSSYVLFSISMLKNKDFTYFPCLLS